MRGERAMSSSSDDGSPKKKTRKSRASTVSYARRLVASTGRIPDVSPQRSASDNTMCEASPTKKERKKRKGGTRSRGGSPPPSVESVAVRRSGSALALNMLAESRRSMIGEDASSLSTNKGRKSGGFRLGKFWKKEPAQKQEDSIGDMMAQLVEEREARTVAKTHFARAATVLHPIPSKIVGAHKQRRVDLSSAMVKEFLENCAAKAASSQGIGVTPAIVSGVLLLAGQFPNLPSAMIPPLVARFDGNLAAVQLHLLELGWGNGIGSGDGSSTARGRMMLEELLDEPDPHFTVRYYHGFVEDIVVPFKLVAAAPPGAFCTFVAKAGQRHQYQTFYKMAPDVHAQLVGNKPLTKRSAAASPAVVSLVDGAIAHETIVAPKVFDSWRTSRRLGLPLVQTKAIDGNKDVPLLADRLRSMRLRTSH
mmetsp:Transcript_8454/g.35323  ORF Transcript_8454/g.35323 Transcript_8454/m.35323 type:complete len:422 (-) Transcript_8454:59-1324(-)